MKIFYHLLFSCVVVFMYGIRKIKNFKLVTKFRGCRTRGQISLVFSTIVVPSEQHSTQRQVLMNFYAIVHCRAEATRVRSYSHFCINDSLACMYVKEDIFLVNSHKKLIESRIDTFEAVITNTIHSRCYHQVPLITNDTLSSNFLSNEALSSYIEMTS